MKATTMLVIFFLFSSFAYSYSQSDTELFQLSDTNRKKAEKLFILGEKYVDNKAIKKAIKHYKLAIKYNPVYVEAYYNLGRAYDRQNKLDKAISQYTLALKYNPKYTKAYNCLMSIYKKLWGLSVWV